MVVKTRCAGAGTRESQRHYTQLYNKICSYTDITELTDYQGTLYADNEKICNCVLNYTTPYPHLYAGRSYRV